MEERDREPPAGLRRAYDPISRGDFDAAVEKAEENVEIVGGRSRQEMANRPADIIVNAYEALSRGDLDAWLDGTTADVELHEVAEVPDARVYKGRHQAREWAEEMLRLVDEWRWAPDEILLEEGDTVVVRASITGRSRAGVPIDLTVFHVIRTEGDKVASFRGFFDRAAAVEAVGPSE